MSSLRSKIIRLAHSQPVLRGYLLPLLMEPTTKTASLSAIAVAFAKWVASTPDAKAKIAQALAGELTSAVETLHHQNRPPTPAPSWLAPKTKGRKKVTPAVEPPMAPVPHVTVEVTPERVLERTMDRLDASLFSVVNEWVFQEWFDKFLQDAADPLYFNYPPWVHHSNTEIENGNFVWSGTLVGDTLAPDVEVPDHRSLENDKVEKLIRVTGGKSTRFNQTYKFIRNYGDHGEMYVVYELRAEWPIDAKAIAGKLFTDGELTAMAQKAVNDAKDID